MRLKRLGMVAVACVAVGSIGLLAAGGSTVPAGPPALRDPSVPSMPRDLGVGERLIIVVGGVFPSWAEAEEANTRFDFAELQGLYVVPVSQFRGLRRELHYAGAYALVSAFRTLEGAREFVAVAEQAGAHPRVTGRVTSLGGLFAGLGQEADPDGSGPLTHSVPASRP